MTLPGVPEDNEQPGPTSHDPGDALEQQAPATREADLTEATPHFAPRLSGSEVVPAFSVALPNLGLQSAVSKMIAAQDYGLSKTINQQAASLAASMPKPSLVNITGPALSAIQTDLGLQSAVSKMIAAPDLGLSKMSAATVASHQKLLRNLGNISSDLALSVNFSGIGAALVSLADLLQRWREVAESGLGVLRGLARTAFKAALRARAGVLRGDDEPVARFIEAWLDLHATPERIEAVGAALLEEGWDTAIPDDPMYLVTDLRKRTVRQSRALRPIWETQLNYRTVGMLDEPTRTGNGTLLTVADLIPGAQSSEDLVLAGELEEQRLRRVLGRLKPDELAVTSVYAQRRELSWAEAARIAGAADPAAMGERIRRKLKRLGAEDKRRVALRSSL